MKHVLVLSFVSILALFLCVSVSPVSAALDDGLISHYEFEGDGNVLEDSAGDNAGDLGSAVREDDGRFGKAIRFTENTNSASVPGSESLTFTGSFTIAAWIRPDVLGMGGEWPQFENRLIFSNQFNLDVLHGRGRFEVRNTSDAPPWVGTAWKEEPLALGEWHLTVGTYNADENMISHYVNGSLDGTAEPEGVAVEQSPIRFGHMGIQCMVGSLDDVRFYGRAFSAEDVMKLYEYPTSVSPDGSLVVTWGSLKNGRK